MLEYLLQLLLRFAATATVCLAVTATVSAQNRFRGMTASSELLEDYSDLRLFGANLVAFQIAYPNLIAQPTAEEYQAFLDTKLAIVDRVLEVVEANGMKLLLVLFSPPGGMNDRAKPHRHRLFEGDAYHQQYIAAWQTIAARYQGRSGIYGYDLLNEPAVGKVGRNTRLWNKLAREVVAAIRALDNSVKVVIEPPYGNPQFMNKLSRISDRNLAYSFHSYFTSAFRNQGLNGRPINVRYPKNNRKNPKKGFNRSSLLKSVIKAKRFQRVRRGTEVLVGEFAAPRWAPKGSSARYLRDSIRIFERFKWSWANHAWREADVWSPEHSNDANDSTRSLSETDRARVLKSFFRKNQFAS